MTSHLNTSIDQIVEATVLEALQEVVQAKVDEILMDKLADDDFADKVDDLMTKAADKTVTHQKTPEYKYKTVDEFVDRFIRRQYAIAAHRDGHVNWSREWYRHPEVVARFRTLWHSYERARQEDPNGFLEEFLRVEADSHMKEIMKDRGVFANCKTRDTPSVPLPVTPAPEAGRNDTEKRPSV